MSETIFKNDYERYGSEYLFWKKKNWYYNKIIKDSLKNFIPENKRILELGCGFGDKLNNLNPSFGVGVDISEELINIAKQEFQSDNLKFFYKDILDFESNEEFDYVLLIDVLEHSIDWKKTLEKALSFCKPKTTLILMQLNHRMGFFRDLASEFGFAIPEGKHYWVKQQEFEQVFRENNFSFMKFYPMFFPFPFPKNEKIVYFPIVKHFSWEVCYIVSKA